MFLYIQTDGGEVLLINSAHIVRIEDGGDHPVIFTDRQMVEGGNQFTGINYSFEELVKMLAPKAMVPIKKRHVPTFPKGHWRYSELEKMISHSQKEGVSMCFDKKRFATGLKSLRLSIKNADGKSENQKDFGERFGKSQKTIWNWEGGLIGPRSTEIESIAKTLADNFGVEKAYEITGLEIPISNQKEGK